MKKPKRELKPRETWHTELSDGTLSLGWVDDQDRAKKWAEETKRKAVRFREVIE